MYCEYYGLSRKPFHITPDPEFLYLSPSHKKALGAMDYGVEHRKGFVAVTGDVGLGKTTLIRAFLERLDKNAIKIVYLFNANISFHGFLKVIFMGGMRCVRAARRGFFPLDEELQLLAGHYTPTLYEAMTRLSTWMPFARAVKEVGYFRHTQVPESTVRQTEAVGAAYVTVQTCEVERWEQELPPAPQGPAQLFLSVAGAFVPLVGGEWAEVKTFALGEVAPPRQGKGETVIQIQALSYFSRLTDSTTFQRLALVETHRRGVETAGAVGVVTAGAEGCQSFIAFHRPEANRPSTVHSTRADLILVMDGGRIVECGTHHELLAQGGRYREIYDLQLRDQEQFREEMDHLRLPDAAISTTRVRSMEAE